MRPLFYFLIAMFSITNVFSQDIITLKNGDEIKSKVLEVSSEQVKYKKWDNMEGPTYSSQKAEIFMIKYQNGTKDVFKIQETVTPAASPVSNEEKMKSDAVKNLENYLKNKIQAPIYLSGFRKTNGTLTNMFGLMIYTINFDVDLKFIADGWLKGNGLEGYWSNNFYVYPSKPDLAAAGEQYMYATKLFPSGTMVTLGCIAEMKNTDNGFLVQSLKIKTETTYGLAEDTQSGNSAAASESAPKPKAELKRLTTTHKGYFFKSLNEESAKSKSIRAQLEENYTSKYILNSDEIQPSVKKNIFYRSTDVAFTGAQFGLSKNYKDDILLVKHGDSLSLNLFCLSSEILHKKSKLYSNVWTGKGEYLLFIQVSDASGKEYYTESWDRELNTSAESIFDASVIDIPIRISPEKLKLFPASQDLYLSFLVRGKKEKDSILEGFSLFKVE